MGLTPLAVPCKLPHLGRPAILHCFQIAHFSCCNLSCMAVCCSLTLTGGGFSRSFCSPSGGLQGTCPADAGGREKREPASLPNPPSVQASKPRKNQSFPDTPLPRNHICHAEFPGTDRDIVWALQGVRPKYWSAISGLPPTGSQLPVEESHSLSSSFSFPLLFILLKYNSNQCALPSP